MESFILAQGLWMRGAGVDKANPQPNQPDDQRSQISWISSAPRRAVVYEEHKGRPYL